MSFTGTVLQLGKEKKKFEDLPFVKKGQVEEEKTGNKITVTMDGHIFDVGPKSLGYRKQVEGKAASPRKALKSFKDMDKLMAKIEKENKTQTNSAERAEKEKTNMTKLNLNGELIDVPENVVQALKDSGVTGDVIEISDFDKALTAASGEDLDAIVAFEETFEEKLTAGLPGLDGQDAGDEPQTGVTPSNIWGEAGQEQQKPERTAELTPEQKQANRLKREQQRKENELKKEQMTGKIEELYKEQAAIENAVESIEALKDLMLIKGQVPLFRTLVPSDTRLRAFAKDTVPAAERTYHPDVVGKPESTETGSKIPQNQSDAKYEVELRESNPSQPTGYFLYIPESLKTFKPSEITYSSEREKILRAAESGNRNLVIKYYPKNEIVNLLLLLKADLVLYDITREEFIETSPRIMHHTRTQKTTQATIYTIRAVDHLGSPTKLSIRQFIPMRTHDTARKSEINLQNLSDALFKTILTNLPNGAVATKFSMLTPESLAKFTQHPKGGFIFNQFKDVETVTAYDSKRGTVQTIDMALPQVEMSNPTSSTAVSRPVFKRTRHSEAGYKPEYQPFVDAVGDEITKTRPQSAAAAINQRQQQLDRMEGINAIMQGRALNIK